LAQLTVFSNTKEDCTNVLERYAVCSPQQCGTMEWNNTMPYATSNEAILICVALKNIKLN
jgi:hypothetical protein